MDVVSADSPSHSNGANGSNGSSAIGNKLVSPRSMSIVDENGVRAPKVVVSDGEDDGENGDEESDEENGTNKSEDNEVRRHKYSISFVNTF